ncbi:MAG TPA: hypothetical protein IAA88_01295 [Candidatus Avimuribaculum pullicola]|nr:hypothetical protein [Candidatus Avimuribaculum pullicola]
MIFKFHSSPRISWKEWKQFANRYNRRRNKLLLNNGHDDILVEWRLCRWDYDFCKEYRPSTDYRQKRK